MTQQWASPEDTAKLNHLATDYLEAAQDWLEQHEPAHLARRAAAGFAPASTALDTALQGLMNACVLAEVEPIHTIHSIAHTVAKAIWMQVDQQQAWDHFGVMVADILAELNSQPAGHA